MGNRWQRVWGVSWGLLGLWSTSWSSLWWCSTRESYLLFSAVICKTKLCYYRDVSYTVMILFYNLSAYVCDWSLGIHELVHSILSLKLDVAGPFHALVLGVTDILQWLSHALLMETQIWPLTFHSMCLWHCLCKVTTALHSLEQIHLVGPI